MGFLRHRRKHFRDSGGWPDGDGYIYKEGLYEDDWVEGIKIPAGTFTKNADNLQISLSPNKGGDMAVVTDSTVYLTSANTLKIDWECPTGYPASNAGIIISTNKTAGTDTYTAKGSRSDKFARLETTLDLTGIASGNYYVRFHAATSVGSNLVVIKAYNIWIE